MGIDYAKTYREIALEQAVLSHGKTQQPGYAHGQVVAVSVPNDPESVANAALVYERVLDRPPRELVNLAKALDAALDSMGVGSWLTADIPVVVSQEGIDPMVEAREAFKRWLSVESEPF